MSSRYSKVQSSIWTSDKFNQAKEFSKIVYMYLLSCPHGNSAGFYRLPEGYATTDLRCSQQRYRAALEDLRNVGLIEYDGDIIFIRQFIRWNPIMNPKHAKGTYTEIEGLATSPLYELFYNDVKTYCEAHIEQFTYSIETVSKPLGYTETKTETDTETKTETDTDSAEQSAPPVITLTLNDNTEYPVTQKQVDEWKPLYPGVDVIQQLRNMRGWLTSNPKRRKTSSGILRFITGWLAREQDSGKSRDSPQDRPRGYLERPTENYDHLAIDVFADEKAGTG